MKFLTSLFTLLFVFAANFGCAKSVSKGGQDGGGGNTVTATAQEVKEDFSTIWQVAILGNDDSVFFYRSLLNQTQKVSKTDLDLDEASIQRIREVGKKVFLETSDEQRKIEQPSYYLRKSKLVLKANGSCAAHENDHADASVSAFSYGADLCFSIDNLMRTPKSTLRLEILGLLVHEMAHLSGFGEEDAKLLQKAIVRSSSNYFYAGYVKENLKNITEAFDRADETLSVVISEFASDQSNFFVLTEVFPMWSRLARSMEFTSSDDWGIIQFALEPRSKDRLSELSYLVADGDLEDIRMFPTPMSYKDNVEILKKRDIKADLKNVKSVLKTHRLDFYLYVETNFPELVSELKISKEPAKTFEQLWQQEEKK